MGFSHELIIFNKVLTRVFVGELLGSRGTNKGSIIAQNALNILFILSQLLISYFCRIKHLNHEKMNNKITITNLITKKAYYETMD